ncbi:hypothetical protein GGR57DRAFT_448504 [Xylariaceae sp. FL1272]|nr:hypothetical protein GGR57DRAFT_448504 [Xylariaceae sp. FL1272]
MKTASAGRPSRLTSLLPHTMHITLRRFSARRMKDVLYPAAQRTSDFAPVLAYMRHRSAIRFCQGPNGALDTLGIKWYGARDNVIPPMAICEACYEEQALAHPASAEAHLEPSPVPQPADQVWACDFPVPYQLRAYHVRAAADDWPAFVSNGPMRFNVRPCPGAEHVLEPSTYTWYKPVDDRYMPRDLVVSQACYVDYVALTGQEGKWRTAQFVAAKGKSKMRCGFAPMEMRLLVMNTLDTKDWALFWEAMEVVAREPVCDGKGQGMERAVGTRYTRILISSRCAMLATQLS